MQALQREPTATRWVHGPPFLPLHLVASSSVAMEVDKARAIDVSPLNEGGWIWLCAPLLDKLSLSNLSVMVGITRPL